MATKTFDRETLLDLVVNFIPLGIILFFIATFVVFTPWGFDLRTSGVMLAIMGVTFAALAVLTYLSAKAIAGDEKRATVYAQGQAGLEGAKPLHEHEEDAESAPPDAGGDGDEEDNEGEETVDDADETADDAAAASADNDADDADDNDDTDAAAEDSKPEET